MFAAITKILKPLLIMSIIIVTDSASAQNYHSSSKKAIRYFEKARESYTYDSYKSLDYIEKSLSYDDKFIDALLLKAEICVDLSKDSVAIEAYERLLDIDSLSFAKCSVSLSRLYAKYFYFEKSLRLLSWYLSLNNQKEIHREWASSLLKMVELQKFLVENPVDYNPKNIGNLVNSSYDEYVNQYYVNENKIIFTKHKDDGISQEESVFVSIMIDSVWSVPNDLLSGLESYGDVGAAFVSSDGNEIYFSGCSWDDGCGSCDIYFVEFKNGRWSTPRNIKSVNTSEWESQPCVSCDGKELYFVRGNKRTGTSDIFVSYRDGEGNWLRPKRLDFGINTDGNEMAPFLHHDGKTLYFSSDKHLGMGGFDLFVVRRDENGKWSDPINLGYPLNTSGNEINLVVSNDANKAYISALRKDGYGGYDIYEFDIDEKFKPQAVEIDIPSDEQYYATALAKNESVILKNIFFEFDSAELTSDSEEGIITLYNFLNENSEIIVLLEGHTDDTGNEEYNFRLSERRAESVKDALIDKGIIPDRIKTKGCGSTQPLFPNNFDDELRAFNRRVSMTVTKDQN